MTESGPTPNPYGHGALVILERRMRDGNPIDDQALARLLREAAGLPLPQAVLELVCDRLTQKQPLRRRGRKPADRSLIDELKLLLAPHRYERLLRVYKRQNARLRRRGTVVRSAEWKPPHQKAAERITEELFPHLDWRRVQNILSSRNTGRV